MPFTDLLRMTVLLAGGSATVLAAITVLAANREDDTRTLIVAAIWWTAGAVIGLILGRRKQAADAMRPLLSGARTSITLPSSTPGRVAIEKLWPLGVFAVIAGVVGFIYPGVAAIGTGFALAAALAFRAREGAVTAIEERDGIRFHVEPGSALQPVELIRTPGLRRDRPPGGHQPPPPRA